MSRQLELQPQVDRPRRPRLGHLAKYRITENHARWVERCPVQQIEELGSELQSGLLDPPKIPVLLRAVKSKLFTPFVRRTDTVRLGAQPYDSYVKITQNHKIAGVTG